MELMAIPEDSGVENTYQVHVTYIPPAVDEITDEEVIDENPTGEGANEGAGGAIAGTFVIYTASDANDNIPLYEFVDSKKKAPNLVKIKM